MNVWDIDKRFSREEQTQEAFDLLIAAALNILTE